MYKEGEHGEEVSSSRILGTRGGKQMICGSIAAVEVYNKREEIAGIPTACGG
jgi:hypothetical protein